MVSADDRARARTLRVRVVQAAKQPDIRSGEAGQLWRTTSSDGDTLIEAGAGAIFSATGEALGKRPLGHGTYCLHQATVPAVGNPPTTRI